VCFNPKYMNVTVALLVAVSLGEAVVLLVHLVNPLCHHVTYLDGSSWAVTFEAMVRVLGEESILEVADDVLVGDVGYGGTHLEGTPGVEP
jgi:hypothetical protein